MNINPMSFEAWMKEVDSIFADFYQGFTSDDFEDYLWFDAYANGATPEQAFTQWGMDNR